ncbi:hypothetical protein HY624_01960 [Candidatus Uhrbacteria bacterium]|nr:hypothetical protein [Candidatus Uhrbacteria bacterium]
MTYKQFLKVLSELKVHWHLTSGGMIRCRRGGRTYSPLTAVIRWRTSIPTFTVGQGMEFSSLLGMRRSIASQIDGASCVPNWIRRDIRDDLLRATGLGERKRRSGSMRLKDFLRLLPKVNAQWRLESGRIRGHLNEHKVCPITAVAQHEFGERYVTSDHRRAACDLGLRDEVAYNLAEAIDGEAVPARTRNALLRATGLLD